ncbi:MAG: restriction endonuclease [Solirubrobacteraceae bacterium]
MNAGADLDTGDEQLAARDRHPPASGLAMDEVLRDARPKSVSPPQFGQHRNLYAATALAGARFIPFESGINAIAGVKAPEGNRVPAIIIASSPHKVGRVETPWQDIFDVDSGHIRFYGDNKTSGRDPARCRGNAALLAANDAHADPSRDVRRTAVPLVFFRRVPFGGRRKGFARFEGFGAITRIERVVQRGDQESPSFSNYAFDFLVMDLAAENEIFPWSWINMRRDPNATLDQTVAAAPRSWRTWIVGGVSATERVRRRVARRFVHSRQEQMPEPGSPEDTILTTIYRSFDGRKLEFEGVAAWVAERVLTRSGDYRHFGVTRGSADGGFDFVGRLDVGDGFGRAKIVVLGQAKCESLRTPTNGLDVARTVARLRRGWIGVYVTTSFFSDRTQQEVLEDRYPVLLINGRRLAEEVRTATIERGDDIASLLAEISGTHGAIIDISDPDQVLFHL